MSKESTTLTSDEAHDAPPRRTTGVRSSSNILTKSWPFLLICLAAAGICIGVSNGGEWPTSHEKTRYLVLAEHFRDAIQHGVLWPRWLPNVYGGHGYPTFVFYQPLVFFLYLPFRAVTGDPVLAMHAVVGLALSLGGIASYLLGARRGDRVVGFFAAGLFFLTPYIYVNWLVRGDLSELLAMCLVPWVLLFLQRLDGAPDDAGPRARDVVGLALSSVAVVVSHPITAALLAPLLVLMTLILAVGRGGVRWRFLGSVVLAGLSALLLATPYWQPLVTLRAQVYFERAFEGYFQATGHTVLWHQLLDGPWGYGGSRTNQTPDGMSFEVGKLQLAAALSGAVIAWKSRSTRAALAALLVALFAMTPQARALWLIPPFEQMQFPWRILSVVAGFQIALAAGWAGVLRERFPMLRALVLGMLLVAIGWKPGQFTMSPSPRATSADVLRLVDDLERIDTLTSRNEFLPRSVVTMPRKPAGPMVQVPDGVAHEPLPGNDRHRIRWGIEADRPIVVSLGQFYFPGWRVEVDGEEIPDAQLRALLEDDGHLRIPISPGGRRILTARYTGPPGIMWRLAGWLGGCVLLVAIGWRGIRRARAVPQGAVAS